MRAIALLIVFLMFCVNVYAEDSSGLLIIKNPNLSASVVSSKVDMGKMDYAYNNPTTVDKSGNFYFCSSENNRLDSLWKVSRVNSKTGNIDEICRLDLSSNKYRFIRSINYVDSGKLYIWLATERARSGEWQGALVEISGLQ